MLNVEQLARVIQSAHYDRNPTWGGEDDWEQIPEHRRDDYRWMATAVLKAQAAEEGRELRARHAAQ